MAIDIGIGLLVVAYIAVLVLLIREAHDGPPRFGARLLRRKQVRRPDRIREQRQTSGRHSKRREDTDVYARIERINRQGRGGWRTSVSEPAYPRGRRQHRQHRDK